MEKKNKIRFKASTQCSFLFSFFYSNVYNILDECILAQQQQHDFN